MQNLINELKRGNTEKFQALTKENEQLASLTHVLGEQLKEQVTKEKTRPKKNQDRKVVKKAKYLEPSKQVNPALNYKIKDIMMSGRK